MAVFTPCGSLARPAPAEPNTAEPNPGESAVRPRLRPSLVRVWRDRHTLQLGLDPARAVLVTGLDPALARFVERVDGTRTPDELYDTAGRLGVAPGRTRELLDLLAGHHLLEDADAGPAPPHDRLAPDRAAAALLRGRPDGGTGVLGRRGTAAVAVRGAGRVGAAVASLLAAAGVGTVEVTDRRAFAPGDAAPAGSAWNGVRKRRETAAREALRRVAPDVRLHLAPGRRGPDVVVVAPDCLPDPGLGARLTASGSPHLYAAVRETTGIVGPFVLPGRSPCGRCLDLRRRDLDPGWPRVATQLAAAAEYRPPQDRPCDGVLATGVASLAALQVLMYLDGDTPTATGATVETLLPDGALRRRTWYAHPACECRAFAHRPAATPAS